jgi:hypothetical protein
VSVMRWERSAFASGGAENAFHLFCFSATPLKEGVVLSAERFGLPAGGDSLLEVREIPRAVDPQWFDGFRSGALRTLAAEALGSLAELDAAKTMVVVMAQRVDAPDLLHLQAGWAVAKWSVARGCSVVLDAQCNRFWRAADIAEWAPNRPFALSAEVNVVVEAEPTASQAVLHTRGMKKFGRPDLVVEGVPASRWNAVAALLRQFASQQAMGAVLTAGEQVAIEGGWATFSESAGDPLHLDNRSLLIRGISA